MKCILIAVLLTLTVHFSLGARILAVLPLPIKSHHIMFQAILKALAERGHEIVAYTSYSIDTSLPNLTNIKLDAIQSMDKIVTKEDIDYYKNLQPHTVSSVMIEEMERMLGTPLENPKIKDLINSDEKYDLVILEAFYAQEAFLALGYKFNAPVVNIHPFGAYPVVSLASGNPLNLADNPDFAVPFSDEMSFFERAYNAYAKLTSIYEYYTIYLPHQQELMSAAFKDLPLPPIEDLIQNISLYVNNGHAYANYAQAIAPNTVPLGGIHLTEKRKPLPSDIKKFLDKAENGVIYFSLGSIVTDQVLGEQFFDYFIGAFRQLPQRILWKTNSDYPNLSDNVMTAKWLPQQEILAHPNVVAFVTHGGLFSLHEAVYAGVPVVCIPFFLDQPMNAKFYEAKEVGVKIHFTKISEEKIFSSIQEVINDRKYKENMKKLSNIFRDEPQTPSDRLAYWVNYVLQHDGAHHLRPATTRMRWYQVYLLDVLGIVLGSATLVVILIYLTLRQTVLFVISKRKNNFKKLNSKKNK